VDLAAGVAQSTAAGDAAGVGVDAFSGVDHVFGSAFDDILYGSDILDHGVEAFRGNQGNDYIDGRGGAQDVAEYTNDIAGVTVNLSGQDAVGGTGIAYDGWGNTDTLLGIEWVRGSAYHDSLTGDSSNNWFTGEGGADFIAGGAGNDWADYRNDAAGITVNLNVMLQNATDGSGSLDTLISIENIRGSMFDDVLIGDGGSNRLRGLAGDDFLDGGDNSSGNWADYRNDIAGVTVNLATGTATDGWGDTDTLAYIQRVAGSSFADVITGSIGNNRLQGWEGDDLLTGNGGNDFFVFADGDGNDKIIDFAGNGSLAGDTIDLTGVTTGVIDYTDLVTNHVLSNTASGVVFDFGGGDTLTLQGVTLANLHSSDFLF
jgi:Ca2+-binding RTX toxin-like protein